MMVMFCLIVLLLKMLSVKLAFVAAMRGDF